MSNVEEPKIEMAETITEKKWSEKIIFRDFREIGIIIRFEFKRIILSLKFFIALTLTVLPAILFLFSISSSYDALLLDLGVEGFQNLSAKGYTLIGQFLMQMMGLMLILDSFGQEANESMKRYFTLPVRKWNIYRAHFITVLLGVSITSFLSVSMFNLFLWVWTGYGITFKLMMQSFLMTVLGALLAIAVTLLFVMIAHTFKFSGTIALIPTLLLFYILPFLVNFIAFVSFSFPEGYQWTFMHHLSVITQRLFEKGTIGNIEFRNSALIIGLTAFGTESMAKTLFLISE